MRYGISGGPKRANEGESKAELGASVSEVRRYGNQRQAMTLSLPSERTAVTNK